MSATLETRALRALKSGPLYRPAWELVLDVDNSTELVTKLLRAGLVEIAADIGPATYRLTDAGREAVG